MNKVLSYIFQHRLLGLALYFILFSVCTFAFVEIADEVLDREALWIDEAILQTINSYSTVFWDSFFVILTNFGGVWGVVTIAAGLIALLVLRRKYKAAITVGASVAGAALLNAGLKLLFERTRPDLWEQLVIETSFSFPSGHSMASAALGLSIILIFWKTRFRWYAVIFSSLYIVLIGFSRLYLGVHYPTDVLAGWLVSGAWVSVVGFVLHSYGMRVRGDKK